MSFSYDFTNNASVAYIRLLISDTQASQAIFSDEEIAAFYVIQQSQFQSGMYYSGSAGVNLPSVPVSYLRVAALALGTMASSNAKLSSVVQLLDVKLDPSKAAQMLRDQAQEYRDIDDNAGAICIIEQVNNSWSFADRWWRQFQRQQVGV
jgi:hypothetical protein